jgi:hypothetical protein
MDIAAIARSSHDVARAGWGKSKAAAASGSIPNLRGREAGEREERS